MKRFLTLLCTLACFAAVAQKSGGIDAAMMQQIREGYRGKASDKAVKNALASTPISTLAKNGDEYTFKTTMPDFDVDYIVVSKSDEEFVPKMLNVDENGNIVISTYEDLRSVSHYVNTGIEAYTKANYVLANDIDLLDRGIEPIGANNENSAVFAGTFDGQGHTLSNIRILSSHQNGYASLFARVSGEIKNFLLTTAKFLL